MPPHSVILAMKAKQVDQNAQHFPCYIQRMGEVGGGGEKVSKTDIMKRKREGKTLRVKERRCESD